MRLLILFFVSFLSPLVGRESFELGNLPPAPNSGVYDPEQWLTAQARVEIEESMARAKLNWKTQVFLVVLPERPEADGDVLARAIAEGWGAGRLWGVAIHVVGDPEFPAFYAGRKDSFGWPESKENEFTADLNEALADVTGRAMREGDHRLQVQTGIHELSGELGYLGIMMSRIDRLHDKARGEGVKVYRKKQSNARFIKRLLLVLVPLALLVVGIVISRIRKKRKETRVDFYFPETSPRRRFRAPWSGGGDVIVKFGSRIQKDGSRKG